MLYGLYALSFRRCALRLSLGYYVKERYAYYCIKKRRSNMKATATICHNRQWKFLIYFGFYFKCSKWAHSIGKDLYWFISSCNEGKRKKNWISALELIVTMTTTAVDRCKFKGKQWLCDSQCASNVCAGWVVEKYFIRKFLSAPEQDR